jgi:Rod binding domain-containing protein
MKGQVPGDRRTLAQVAVEAETQFLTQLLEKLRTSMVRSLTSPQSEKMQGYQSLVDQNLARAMALGGGLGLARRIFSDLEARIPEAGKETTDGEQKHQGESDFAPARDVPL